VSAFSAAQQEAVEAAYRLFGPLRLRSCPLEPTPRQEAFLLLRELEVLYGGAAAGGKSVALLMAALQYCDVPGYDALLLRPSMPEFRLPGGLVELSHDWLAGSKAHWSGEQMQWRFPGPGKKSGTGGATLGFGYLNDPNDISRYAGTSYSFVGFDELVRFNEQQYRRMFRVLRQPDSPDAAAFAAAADGTRLPDVPVRARATSNPGGPGHGWVKSHFVDPATRHPGALFLPAHRTDNPHINQTAYLASLEKLPSAERERLLRGDWEIPDEGELFQRDWFQVIDPGELPTTTRAVRFWDLAATEPGSANPDPDYTVGLRLDLDEHSGTFYITHLVRARKGPGAVEKLIAATANHDGRTVSIVIEQQPGGAGVHQIDTYKRHVLRGYNVRARRPSGAKDVRAQPVAAAAENGLIKIIRGRHLLDFLEEVCAFPNAPHDDCVDALAGAHTALARAGPRNIRSSVPRGRIPNVLDRSVISYRHPRSRAAARLNQLQRTHDADAQLAAQIGVPLYQPGTWQL
jgi:predicted phage terminase large subunit-like protein